MLTIHNKIFGPTKVSSGQTSSAGVEVKDEQRNRQTIWKMSFSEFPNNAENDVTVDHLFFLN